MDKPIEKHITTYLKSQSRNKVVLFKENIFDFKPINVGYILSQALYNLKGEDKLPMLVSRELNKILNASITDHSNYGRMLAISNLGILLEPNLKQDINNLFEKYSNNNVLFVQWEGELDSDNLYFLTKEKGIIINIKNLSHIAI